MTLSFVVALAAGCATRRVPVEAPTPTPAPAPAEEEAVPAPPPVELVPVAAPREFRGLWVATVVNLDFPTRKDLTADQARAELATIAETADELGFNVLVFQVRPESDALYRSELEPWSRYLTGEQGRDPGYDPLAILIEEAHARAIEVHAWFNPYRASANAGAPCVAQHVSERLADAVCPWGKVTWTDPGDPAVQENTLAVIEDVVKRYAVDGVHLDDYFYPYPDGGRAFPDQDSYDAYRAGGGTLERDAWRRDNVDSLVRRIGERVRAARPACWFGISPFGIYRPGQPEGIRGMDQVVALHADPMVWYRAGWVDYLAPQLYWSTKREAQRYDRLLTWWNGVMDPARPLLVGLDLTKVGTNDEYSIEELRTWVTLARAAEHTSGHIWFRTAPILANQAGVADLLTELYAEPALPPPKPGLAAQTPPPTVSAAPDGVAVAPGDGVDLRAYVLYQVPAEGEPVMVDVLPPTTETIPLEPGVYAISAVGPGAVESAGVRVTIGS